MSDTKSNLKQSKFISLHASFQACKILHENVTLLKKKCNSTKKKKDNLHNSMMTTSIPCKVDLYQDFIRQSRWSQCFTCLSAPAVCWWSFASAGFSDASIELI